VAIKLTYLKKKPPGGEYSLDPQYGKIAAGYDALDDLGASLVEKVKDLDAPMVTSVQGNPAGAWLNPGFNLQGTTTGKFSSSTPNFSNIPKGQTATGWHERLVKLIAEGQQPHKPAKCKHCGKKSLEWVRDEKAGKWYLVSVLGGKLRIHKCGELNDELAAGFDAVLDTWHDKPVPTPSDPLHTLGEIADALKNDDAKTILIDSLAQQAQKEMDKYAKADIAWAMAVKNKHKEPFTEEEAEYLKGGVDLLKATEPKMYEVKFKEFNEDIGIHFDKMMQVKAFSVKQAEYKVQKMYPNATITDIVLETTMSQKFVPKLGDISKFGKALAATWGVTYQFINSSGVTEANTLIVAGEDEKEALKNFHADPGIQMLTNVKTVSTWKVKPSST